MHTNTRLVFRILFVAALSAGTLFAAPTANNSDNYQKSLRAIRGKKFLRNPAAATKDLTLTGGANEPKSEDEAQALVDAELPIPSDDVLKLLREKGIGITAGYGQLTRSATRVTTVQLRYNLFQRDTTTYQNRVNAQHSEKQVAFRGMNKLADFANLDAPAGRELTDMSDLALPASVLSGVYLWAGWTGKEVTVGTEKAKPIMVGLSAGFGPLDRGASTLHLDVGLAFYGNSKMPKDDVYVGLSVDLELFKKLVAAF